MSANLNWRPVSKQSKTLPDELKFILREYCGIDTSKTIWNKQQIPYLAGLRDAGVKGAQELIDILEKHDEIELWLEY